MDIHVNGPSTIETTANGLTVVEAMVQGQPSLEITTTDTVVEAQIVGQSAIECVFEARVLDSYKAVDAELSTTSTNPIQNKTVARALSDKLDKQKIVLMSQEEYDALETKDDVFYFLYEE